MKYLKLNMLCPLGRKVLGQPSCLTKEALTYPSFPFLSLRNPLEKNPRRNFFSPSSLPYLEPRWPHCSKVSLLRNSDLQCVCCLLWSKQRLLLGEDNIQCARLEAGLEFFMAVIPLKPQSPRIIHGK